jgi:acetyl-CoA acyltransferase
MEKIMQEAFICDGIRTPFGRYGGALASVRPDDLAALVMKSIVERNPGLDVNRIDDVIFGCANQAGEDNRNVARMALLLAGLPKEVPGVTVNRLCGSSLDAVISAARSIKSGELDVVIAGGVESMSRAPFVFEKSDTAFSRNLKLEDSTIGWRFPNPVMLTKYGMDAMPATADNVAEEFNIGRGDQDKFALRSQQRAAAADALGILAEEIVAVPIAKKDKTFTYVTKDEHLRPDTTLAALSVLRPVVKANGTVTAGNASGINDGASAILIASEAAVKEFGLSPKARIICGASAGVAPRIMGIGPVDATNKALRMARLSIHEMDVIELNEAFAAQSIAVIRQLSLVDDAPHINPNGGAIALGHPLGASGARLVLSATRQLVRNKSRYALCTMCIGVGQGISAILERI